MTHDHVQADRPAGGDGPRTFLLLQGPPGPFARELGEALRARGDRVLKINFCAGDWLLWRGADTRFYRGTLADWRAWLTALAEREGVTDILYYADQHPYHRVAWEVAREQGIPSYVYEFGYLRPSFLTLERGGMSSWSHLPADPDRIRALDDGSLPDPDFSHAYPHSLFSEASREILYNVASWLCQPLVSPHYALDRMYNPVLEYLSHLPRLIGRQRLAREANALVHDLVSNHVPYWLFPLQIETDYQLRRHSRFPHLRDALDQVVASFARHAPGKGHLVVKLHPLQCGLVPWRRLVREAAQRHGVAGRVHFIDGGSLERLLVHARGTVLVNSTVGLHAFRHGCPVKVLGVAVFDVDGLSFQGPLDAFWAGAEAPDPDLTRAFLRVLAAASQVKGSFYEPEGRAHAIEDMVQRLLGERAHRPQAYVDPPPRLAPARAAGIPV